MKAGVLLTGATGYIGGRHLELLEAEGFPVRCITRRPESLQGGVVSSTGIVAGDRSMPTRCSGQWAACTQLALNALWSPLFFGLRNPLAGLVDIVPLWAVILATPVSFWRISPLAGALLVPYWLWVSFATALNFIWRMNG